MATIDQAIQQMSLAGMPAMPDGHPKTDGIIHRYGKGKKSWYVLHEVQLRNGKWAVYGAFGTWQGTRENATKIETDWSEITAEERAELEQRQREAQEREAARKQSLASNAANRAKVQWGEAATEGISPYAERKQIKTPGMRFMADGTLLVPMVMFRDDGPALVGLQKIAPDGDKRFNKGTAKQGSCCPIGKIADDDRIIFLGEGYATGRTVRECTDDTLGGYIAWDAGNLIHVARMARARHPDKHILICADDDFLLELRMRTELEEQHGITGLVIDGAVHEMTGKDGQYRCSASWKTGIAGLQYLELSIACDAYSRTIRFENTGLLKAHEAAIEIGNASVVSPTFAERGLEKLTDWNDLRCVEGFDVCKAQLAAAILSALMPPDVKARQQEQALAALPSNVVPLKSGKKKSEKKKPVAKSAGAGPDTGGTAAGNGDPPDGEPPENSELRWEAHLVRNDKGQVLPVLSNVVDILKHAPEWQGVVAYEEFSGQVVKLKAPPYERGETGEWTDMDDLRTALWLQKVYRFHPREDIVMKAILLAADLHSHHVVRAYLDPLEWDGKERLAMWMVDYLGAEDTEYVRRVSRKFMIGAVARIYQPGVKMDNVLILEGTQGLYKSTALKVLAGEWFTDAPLRFGDKDSYAIMRGKWFIELAELDSFNKADSEAAKQFFGQYIDRYRNFYGKRASDVPRQQVFAGTTNKYVYLKDETGNRRYWPVRALEVNLDGLREARDQLWAEAVVAHHAKEAFWETPADVELFREEQGARFVNDAYTDEVARGILGKTSVTIGEVLGDILKLDIAKWTMPEQQRVGRCLAQLGWIRKRGPMKNGKRDWMYVKPELAATDTPPAPEDDDPI